MRTCLVERTVVVPVTENQNQPAPLRSPNLTCVAPLTPQTQLPRMRSPALACLNPAPTQNPKLTTPNTPLSPTSSSKASQALYLSLSAWGPTDLHWKSWRRSSQSTNQQSWSSFWKAVVGTWSEPLRSCSPAVLQWNQKRFCLRTQILWFSPQTAISLSTRWLRTRSRLPSGRSVQAFRVPDSLRFSSEPSAGVVPGPLSMPLQHGFPNRLDTPSCWEIHWAVAKPGPSCTTIWLCGIPWHYSSSISCAHSTSLRSQAPQPEWSAAHRSSPAGPPRSIESASRRRAVLSLPNRACLLQMRSMMKDLTPQTPGSWTLPPKSSAVWIAGWGKIKHWNMFQMGSWNDTKETLLIKERIENIYSALLEVLYFLQIWGCCANLILCGIALALILGGNH